MWLQRPLTARWWKRGWPVFFRRGHRGRNLDLWGKRVTGAGVPHTSDPVMQAAYQAFISYSHAADDELSPVIQSALQRFAKAWYQLRAMRVFRDRTGLSASPALWGSIEKALASSEYFLLLASPQSAQSHWVQREIDWWIANRPLDRLLILVTHGELAWDSSTGDFDWSRTTALPQVLRGRMSDEPLYVDFRWADAPEKRSLRHTQFRSAILDIAATVRGIPKDALDGEDVRQHRRTRVLATVMVLGILAFAVVAGWQAYVATVQRGIATAQRNTALSRLLAAQSLKSATDPLPHLDLALLQGVAAYRIQPTAEARRSIVSALMKTNRVKKFVHASGTLVSLALSPDGKTIATGDSMGHLVLWDAGTLQQTSSLENGTDFVDSLAFSPDGRMLAAADSEQVVLWSLAGERATKGRTLKGKSRLTDLTWSPDGTTIYSNDVGTLRWDAATGADLTPIGADDRISRRRLLVSPDGTTIVTAGDDPAITLWDATTGQRRRTLEGRSRTVTSLAFNREGSLLASGGDDGTITLWDTMRGVVRTTLQRDQDHVDSLALSEDGSTLASGSRNNLIVLWNVTTSEVSEVLVGHTNSVMQLVFARSGKELISSAFNDTFIVWNLGVRRQRALLRGDTPRVRTVAVSPEGTIVASAGDEGTIRLWDIATGKERAALTGHRGDVLAIAFNPASRVLVSGGEDRRILLWDITTGRLLQEIDAHGEVESLAIHPDGKTLAWAAKGTHQIFRWDLTTGGERMPLTGHDTSAESLEFSRDGKLLVSAGGSTIRVWDAATGREVKEPNEVGTALRATISPDGRQIASSQTFPPVILLWDLQSRMDPIELTTQNFTSDYNQAFSPDGRMLAYSAGEAGLNIVLANLADGKASWTIEAPPTVRSITFTPDGKRLVTGHSNGQLGIWDVDVERWPQRACEIANRNLTHEEWKAFVGGEIPYQPVCVDLSVPKD